jgi:hypothetical protein
MAGKSWRGGAVVFFSEGLEAVLTELLEEEPTGADLEPLL